MSRPAAWRERYGPWAVVTGASSGIGEELARQLAGDGLDLVVAARRVDRLEKLRDELAGGAGREVRVVEADLSTADGVAALARATAELDVGLAVLNAGYGMKGRFHELDREAQVRMVELNCISTLRLAHVYAERLAKRGRGGLILTSSTAAFQGIPFSTTYAATKGFGLQLAEGMACELAPFGVDVVALCPGPTDTEGPRRTGVDPDDVPVKMMPVAPVARAALDDLGRRRITVPGATNRIGSFATRLLPRSVVANAAGRLMRRAMGQH